MTRSTAILFLIPTILAGIALAAALALTQSAEGSGNDATLSELIAIREQLRSIEEEVDTLRKDVAIRERRLPVLPPSREVADEMAIDEAAVDIRIAALESKLSKLPSSSELAAAASRDVAPQAVSQVKAALEVIREEERVAEADARAKRELERIQDRVNKLAGDLNLTPGQVDDMASILAQEATARNELFGGGRGRGGRGGGFAGMDRNEMREKMSSIRETRDQELAKVLDGWQLEEYKKMEDDNPRGFGGRGGGRGNRNDGGNADNGNNGGGRRGGN